MGAFYQLESLDLVSQIGRGLKTTGRLLVGVPAAVLLPPGLPVRRPVLEVLPEYLPEDAPDGGVPGRGRIRSGGAAGKVADQLGDPVLAQDEDHAFGRPVTPEGVLGSAQDLERQLEEPPLAHFLKSRGQGGAHRRTPFREGAIEECAGDLLLRRAWRRVGEGRRLPLPPA